MDKQLDQMSEYLSESNKRIHSRKQQPMFLLSVMVNSIKELQKFQARMKIVSYFPAIKKTKQFEKINSKADELWDNIFHVAAHDEEGNLINELMINFPYVRIVYPTSQK